MIELVGINTDSWEHAAHVAAEQAAESLGDLRIAEVVERDPIVEPGKIQEYRTKTNMSTKFEN